MRLLHGDIMQALQNRRLLDVVEDLHHFGAELVELGVRGESRDGPSTV